MVVEALGALWSITLDKHSVTAVASEGGIDMIVEAMNLHGANPDALRIGCGALRNIIVNVDYSQVDITDENARGIIAAVVAAMQALPDDTRTQKHGFQTLSQLTRATGGEDEEDDMYNGIQDSPGGAAAAPMGSPERGGARNFSGGRKQPEGQPLKEVSVDEAAGISKSMFTF